VQVSYRLVGGALQIDYAATTDAPTIVNLTNHTCWNLAGEGSGSGSVDEHVLTVNASTYTPVGPGLIPTGEIAPQRGDAVRLSHAYPIGERLREAHPQLQLARGYDHNLVLDRGDSDVLALAARVEEPQSGRVLEIRTTEPGIQVYTGNFYDGTLVGPSGRAYRQGDGVAFETQHFPDAPNHRRFPSTVLRPGSVYRSTTLFRIGQREQ
jgi:aldose 1-epimerase